MTSDKDRQQQLVNDYRSVLGTPAGRRLLTHIMHNLAGTHRSVFSTNSMSMAHSEGKRSVGQTVENEIEAALPGAYASLLAEIVTEATNG